MTRASGPAPCTWLDSFEARAAVLVLKIEASTGDGNERCPACGGRSGHGDRCEIAELARAAKVMGYGPPAHCWERVGDAWPAAYVCKFCGKAGSVGGKVAGAESLASVPGECEGLK